MERRSGLKEGKGRRVEDRKLQRKGMDGRREKVKRK